MENEKIAELISERLYGLTASETDFAFQLFVEKIVLPFSVRSYTNLDMKRYVLLALEKRDLASDWEQKTLSYNEQKQGEER